MFEWKTGLNEKQRVTQNVENLWSIRKNDVPFDRNLGIDYSGLDKPVKNVNSSIMSDMVDIVQEREPRAKISIDRIMNCSDPSGNITVEAVMK